MRVENNSIYIVHSIVMATDGQRQEKARQVHSISKV